MSLRTLEDCLASERCPDRRALMSDWVGTPDSLTERLRATFGRELTHHLHTVGWQNHTQVTSNDHLIWHRQISFNVNETTVVTADVTIPHASLNSPIGLALQYCGARSLGDIIFKDPTAIGTVMQYNVNPSKQIISRSLVHKPFGQTVWITEHFHPELFKLLEKITC